MNFCNLQIEKFASHLLQEDAEHAESPRLTPEELQYAKE